MPPMREKLMELYREKTLQLLCCLDCPMLHTLCMLLDDANGYFIERCEVVQDLEVD